MVITNNYRIVKKGDYYCVKAYGIPICPNCKGELKVRGSKKRWIIELDGERICYKLRQLQCKNCNKVHIEYIDKIVPYKHYSAEAIYNAVNAAETSCVAENSTIRGWKEEWA